MDGYVSGKWNGMLIACAAIVVHAMDEAMCQAVSENGASTSTLSPHRQVLLRFVSEMDGHEIQAWKQMHPLSRQAT